MNIGRKLEKIEKLRNAIINTADGNQWDEEFIRQVKTDFTFYSNKVEGNAMTYGQTIQLLKDFVTPKYASTGDCLDLVNHQQVLDEVFEQYSKTEISEVNIKKIHKALMKNPEQWSDAVHYDPGR